MRAFFLGRGRGGCRIDRLSESGGLVVRVGGFLGMFWLFLAGVLGLRGVWRGGVV